MKDELLKISQQATASTAGRVLVELEPGYRYKSLCLQLISVTGSLVAANYATDSFLRVNGTVQRQVTPAEIDGLNFLNNPPSATLGTAAATPYSMYNAANPGPAQLEWYFQEPWVPQFDASQAYALDLLPGDTASVEVGFVSSTAAPIVRVFCDREPLADVIASGRRINRVDPRTGIPSTAAGSRPTLVKQFKFNTTPGAITHDITQLNRSFSSRDVLQHIRLTDPASRTIEEVQVVVNKREIFKRTKFANQKELRSQMMNPATGFYDIDLNSTSDPRDGVEVGPSDDLLIRMTFDASATGNVAGIIQAFGPAN